MCSNKVTWLNNLKQCCALGLKPLLGGSNLHIYMKRRFKDDGSKYVGNFSKTSYYFASTLLMSLKYF